MAAQEQRTTTVSNTHDTVTSPQQGQDVVLLDRVRAGGWGGS